MTTSDIFSENYLTKIAKAPEGRENKEETLASIKSSLGRCSEKINISPKLNQKGSKDNYHTAFASVFK